MIDLSATSAFNPEFPALWSIIPFIALLLAIAALPFSVPKIWLKYYPLISLGLGLIPVTYYVWEFQHWSAVAEMSLEYFSFISMVGSLFVTAGGIHIGVEGKTEPRQNVLFLAIGIILTNLIGTTGASMLLIRPWIAMNKDRLRPYHIVFFIFTISNCGGCLTPIGDPPLFLGFLKGIPFYWTLQKLWPAWLMLNLALLGIFWVIDQRQKSTQTLRESPQPSKLTWRFSGGHNLLFLAFILGSIFLPDPWRPLVMIACGLGSFLSTSSTVHQANSFDFHPLKEVVWLFLGLFATMMPALDYLKSHSSSLGLHRADDFYYATGVLSSLLDNAPTYLAFLTTALANQGVNPSSPAEISLFLDHFPGIVTAVSLGAVFFGAVTYIGNGPNFMVKAIAEQADLKMPSFFGYIFRYSLPILIPLLVLIGWLLVN